MDCPVTDKCDLVAVELEGGWLQWNCRACGKSAALPPGDHSKILELAAKHGTARTERNKKAAFAHQEAAKKIAPKVAPEKTEPTPKT